MGNSVVWLLFLLTSPHLLSAAIATHTKKHNKTWRMSGGKPLYSGQWLYIKIGGYLMTWCRIRSTYRLTVHRVHQPSFKRAVQCATVFFRCIFELIINWLSFNMGQRIHCESWTDASSWQSRPGEKQNVKGIFAYSGNRLQWHPLKSEFLKNRGRFTKWFWVTIGRYVSYLLPQFEDLVPTSLSSGAI